MTILHDNAFTFPVGTAGRSFARPAQFPILKDPLKMKSIQKFLKFRNPYTFRLLPIRHSFRLITAASLLATSPFGHAGDNFNFIFEDHEAAKMKAETEKRKMEAELEVNERKYWQEFSARRLAFDDHVFADMLTACDRQNKRKGPVGSFSEPLAEQ